MLRKISISLIGITCFVQLNAQDTTAPVAPPKPVISGSLDVYYRFNFANPKSGSYNNFTSFTNSQNSFELGMASIRADHSFGKASVTVDLGFGRRAEEFSYTDGDEDEGKTGFWSLAAIKQAYVSYQVTDKFKLTAGKWGTHVGYELVDAYLNRNYSMSYMFSYGPFFHTGLKADISLGGKSAVMVGIANPTDYSTTMSSSKFIIGQFSTGTSNDKVKLFLNYQGGKYAVGSNLQHIDLVVTAAVADKFSIGFNGTSQWRKPQGGESDNWWGAALYLNADPTSNFGLTLRGEYVDDDKDVLGGYFASKVFAGTLSGNIKIGNLSIIPEIRFDNSNKEIFEKNEGAGTKSTATALVAAVYHF